MVAINADPALVRVVIYCRVSDDRRGGRSVRQQEAELRADCAEHGWTIVGVLKDDDVGASSFSKGERPQWRKVLDMVEAGEVDVIATWEGSRAQRDLELYVLLRRLCIDSGVRWFYSGRLYDMSNWRDRRDTARDAVDDEASSGQTSERGRRDARAAALAGRPHGRRLFGYKRIYDPDTGDLIGQEPSTEPVPGPPAAVAVLTRVLGGTVDSYETPPEADVVRRIFAEYLAGSGIWMIVEGLKEDGLTTGTGVPWGYRQVARVLDNPSYAARRFHNGAFVADGDWPAIIDPDVFDRAQARRASRRGTRSTPQVRLLGTVGRCGKCGGKLIVGNDRANKQYLCKASFCVGRRMGKLDLFVTAALLERLGRRDVRDARADHPAVDPAVAAARARVAELKGRLDEATAQFSADDPGERISAGTLARVEADLAPKIAEAERAVRRAYVPIEIPDLPDDPSALPAWWKAQSPVRQREILSAWIVSVTVLPVGRGRRGYDYADYTEIEWRR